MTEAEWLACDDLVPMMEYLTGKVSDRKLRLFAVICCGWVAHLGPDTPFRRSLKVAERFADGAATTAELSEAEEASNEVYQECKAALEIAGSRALLAGATEEGDDPALTKLQEAADIVSQTTAGSIRSDDFAYTARGCGERYTQSNTVDWLRDIFGNPFRPVVVEPFWLTSTVISLAEAIYADRAFDRLPILADALEDAGCTNPDILDHCRQLGAHVRGCWVVDLVLAKE